MKSFYQRRLAEGRAVLAPMAGYTDAPFRKLCRDFGSAWAVTEMVSARALVSGDLRGIEIGEPYRGEPELVIQVFGGEPEVVAAGGFILWDKYRPDALDVNMGCPVKKVTGKSCGAKLMQDPARAAEIVRQLCAAVPVPVSAKMRLGFDRVNAAEVAKGLEEAGAAALAVHGRTAAQKYGGEADWERVAEVAAAVRIPVIGSGDVTSRAQFERYLSWGLGVMVGRGSLGRPWIFAELRGERPPGMAEVARLAYRHCAMSCSWARGDGERRAMTAMRGQLLKYFAPFETFARMRPDLAGVETLEALRLLVKTHLGLDPAEGLAEPALKLRAA
ncbi:MAG: tRNA-dihydrouridine synthase family protein [Deinococcota bacterium]|jgi:nifR3 family TIM-barrel protein|nr:tRNA-dihydrouridine synthase family protein [Deinococcota bacterium]